MKQTTVVIAAFSIAAGMCFSVAAQAAHAEASPASMTGLTVGVATVDAFMGREPGPPTTGEAAVRIKPLLDALAKQLVEEETFLGDRAHRLSKQAIPAGMQGSNEKNMSVAQAMAISRQLKAKGGVEQVMELIDQHGMDPQYQAFMKLWIQRMSKADAAIDAAGVWLKSAKTKLEKQSEKAQSRCPLHDAGELGEVLDPACVRSAELAYQKKMRGLASAYLGRVAGALSDLWTGVKVLMDEDQQFAKKLEALGKRPMVDSTVAGLEQDSIGLIKGYNKSLRSAVGTALELATFKVFDGWCMRSSLRGSCKDRPR